MEPKTFGPFFVYLYRTPPGSRLIDTQGWTRETEPPFRSGNNWILRVPLTHRAVVIGRWVLTWGDDMEEDALMNALDGRFLQLDAEDIRQWH